MIDAVITRLKAEVSEFSGRVDGAAEFADLMQRGSRPQSALAAYVLPLGLQGGTSEASAGLFVQSVRETVAVVILVNAADALGNRALQTLDPLVKAVIGAVAGWDGGEDALGIFELVRGNLITPGTGLIAYQLEFAINDQLRITP